MALQLVVSAADDEHVEAREIRPSLDLPNGQVDLQAGEFAKVLGAKEMLALGRELRHFGYTPLRIELRDQNFQAISEDVEEWVVPQVISGLKRDHLDLDKVQDLIPGMFIAWIELTGPDRDTVRLFRTGRIEVRDTLQRVVAKNLADAWPKARLA